MKQMATDLWETAPEIAEGVRTHAYVWRHQRDGGVLFYSLATPAQLDAIGPISDQYLSHQDEAGPVLGEISDRLGARLHAPEAELDSITRFAPVTVILRDRGVDENSVEVIPTPGHSPGSTCFLVRGAEGRYLFTGDTLLRGADGAWFAGCVPGHSDPGALASSLDVLADLEPDLVISSAFVGDGGAHPIEPDQWQGVLEQARRSLSD